MQYKHNKRLTPLAKQLRKEMTKEERHLWYDFLRIYPVRFLRQKVVGKYIVDFYCAEARLVVELDGSQHFEEKGISADRERDEYLESLGLKILRFSNLDVDKSFYEVCTVIDNTVKERMR